MLFSAVAVNLPKVDLIYDRSLFMLTALPSASGALLRVPFTPLWCRYLADVVDVQYRYPHRAFCVWLGFAVQDTFRSTLFS